MSSLHRAQELRQERARLYEQAKEVNDRAVAEQRSMNSEEQTTWEGFMDAIDAKGAEIKDIEDRVARMEAAEQAIAQKQERIDDERGFGEKRESAEQRAGEYRSAWKKWMGGGLQRLTPEERELLERNKIEQRALGTQVKGTNASGGFTVPEDFRAELIEAMRAFGGMRQACRVITTADGRDLPWPLSDDTGNTAKIIAEATAPSTTANVPFGQVTLEAASYRSGPILISYELEQDSELDIEDIVRNAMATRFGRVWNTHFTSRSSTESAGPHGIVNDSTGAATINPASGSPTNLIDKMIDLKHLVDPGYRAQPGAAWMMHDGTVALLRKARENSTANTGTYLWQPSLQAGEPDRFDGYPIVVNQDLPQFSSTEATFKPIYFGNWRYYAIRDVRALNMIRLNERYADQAAFALMGFARVDGRSISPSTTPARKPYRCLLATT